MTASQTAEQSIAPTTPVEAAATIANLKAAIFGAFAVAHIAERKSNTTPTATTARFRFIPSPAPMKMGSPSPARS